MHRLMQAARESGLVHIAGPVVDAVLILAGMAVWFADRWVPTCVAWNVRS